MPSGEPTSLEFIDTPLCERMRGDLLDDDAMRQVESRRLTEPRAGALVAATGAARKDLLPHGLNATSERVDLTPADTMVLRQLVEQMEADE